MNGEMPMLDSTTPSTVRLDGRIALVTGGNSGIGYGIARAFALAGAQVLIGGRNDARNAQTVESIRAEGGAIDAFGCDVSNEASVAAYVAHAIDCHGRIDVAVANAGGVESGVTPIEQMTTQEWRASLGVNLDGVFFLYREALKHMIPAGSGSLVAVSSVAAIRTSPAIHYAAAKGGVNSLTMNLSDKLGPKGIRVNAIMPGFVATPASERTLGNEKFLAALLRRIPVGRIGLPQDIAELALFLASDRAGFITGQSFVVDGGMTQT
jgi:NAD(P)-dependent dehydrogenase (short-subunit alcohol dehydrogenase family)